MATTRRSRKKKVTVEAENEIKGIVGSTMEKPESESLQGADVVTLRVSLRAPVCFDAIPDGNGGTKKIILPSLDGALKGKKTGILTPDGNAIFFQLPRADWENLQALYGQQRMFHSWHGNPPCVAEIGSLAEAKKGAYRDEIEAVKTGYAPVDPKAMGVEEDKTEE